MSKGKLKTMNEENCLVLLDVNKCFNSRQGEALENGEGSTEILYETDLPPFFPVEVAR